MFGTKRSVASLVFIVILCGVFLVSFLSGKESQKNNEGSVTVKKNITVVESNGITTPANPTTNKGSEEDEPVATHPLQQDYCTWSPAEQGECKRILFQSLVKDGVAPRRWLFLGDSTVAQFWKTSSLSQVMVDFGVSQMSEACSRRYDCHSKTIDQCHLNVQYDIPNVAPWELPNWEQGEGPSNTTDTSHNHCLGCKNCLSIFPFCSLIDDSKHCRRSKTLSYGGYFAIPYARDVLLQSPSFRTTQENIVLGYIENHLNTPELHDDFGGNPVCVVRTGFHDIAVPHMTQAKYVANVQWYMRVLKKQCSHIVWLQNTAPLLHEKVHPQFPQTVERVRAYDLAVHAMVSEDTALQEIVTTMDVFEASRDWAHNDNIHLDSDWNRALGMFFVKLSTKIGG